MNKKLFSWKALAGLALLVAMGLTSCKQGTEVDPENPTPTKPVTPTAKGTELSGFKTVAELNKLLAETKDITDNIKAGGEVTITLDCSNLSAAAGDKVIIPSKDDATINLIFASALKENKGIVISDAALDVLNIDFPAAEMGDITFDMPYSTLTIDSESAATLGNVAFKVNKLNKKEYATTIGSGITINSIKTWYKDDTDAFTWSGRILAESGAEIVALTIDEDYYTVLGTIGNGNKGYDVPQVYTNLDKWTSAYVENLNIVSNNVRVAAYLDDDDDVVVNKITIAEGDTVRINGAYANEIVGLGEGAVLNNYNGDSPAKYSNLTIDGHDGQYGNTNEPVASTFENCTLVDFDDLYLGQESATGLKFQLDDETTWTDLYYPVYADADDLAYSYEFSKCEFASGVHVNAFAEGDNVLDKNGDPIKQTLYWYNYNDPDKGWIYENGIEKLSDIPAAVRKGEPGAGSYGSYTYEPKVYSFDDLELIPSFSECKYDDKAVSDKNVFNFLSWTELDGENQKPVAQTNYVQIGDELYKRIWSKSNGWILVEQ